jgi:CRISPR-associated protein Csd1
LAPNAARISIRFYYDDDFRDLAKNYRDYYLDTLFEPRPKDRRISINGLVLRTAPARKDRNGQIKFDGEQVSPLLSGELFRAILTGDRFPRALLAQILMRVRSDHLLDSLRISMIKAVIVRDMRKEGRLPKEDYLVRSDPDDPNPARRLGKLFALIERAQLAALGDKVNTTVKDKYLSACAITPAQVFSKLILNAEEHHLKRLRNGHSDADWIKDADHARKVGAAINRDMGRLAATFSNSFPKQHSDEEQGFFLIGYYQERFGSRKTDDDGGDPIDDEQTSEREE